MQNWFCQNITANLHNHWSEKGASTAVCAEILTFPVIPDVFIENHAVKKHGNNDVRVEAGGSIEFHVLLSSGFRWSCGTGSVCYRNKMSILWLTFRCSFSCSKKLHTRSRNLSTSTQNAPQPLWSASTLKPVHFASALLSTLQRATDSWPRFSTQANK